MEADVLVADRDIRSGMCMVAGSNPAAASQKPMMEPYKWNILILYGGKQDSNLFSAQCCNSDCLLRSPLIAD